MKWVDIPAQRLLEVSNEELCQFEVRGDPNSEKLYVRRDGRVFRYAGIQPDSGLITRLCYLEPV